MNPVRLPALVLPETGGHWSYFRVQAQPGPHLHCGPQGQAVLAAACCAGIVWQPQAQPSPGQFLQVQGAWGMAFMAFMAFLLC